eukprot:g3593.t1
MLWTIIISSLCISCVYGLSNPTHSEHWSTANASHVRITLPSGTSLDYTIPTNGFQRVCVTETPILAMLDFVGKASTVVGVKDEHYVSTKSIKDQLAAGTTVGYGSNKTKCLEQNPDLILCGKWSCPGWNEPGIPEFKCDEVDESSPLGRAEWIKPVAALVGADASSQFAQVEKDYNSIARTVNQTLGSNPWMLRPTVFSGYFWGTSWYIPGGRSYVGQLIKDAGGKFINENNTAKGSVALPLNDGYIQGKDYEYWINADFYPAWKTLSDALDKNISFGTWNSVRCGNVWTRNLRIIASGGFEANDALESGIVFPDLLLRDLVKIFHPRMYQSNRFEYYERLVAQRTLDSRVIQPCTIPERVPPNNGTTDQPRSNLSTSEIGLVAAVVFICFTSFAVIGYLSFSKGKAEQNVYEALQGMSDDAILKKVKSKQQGVAPV